MPIDPLPTVYITKVGHPAIPVKIMPGGFTDKEMLYDLFEVNPSHEKIVGFTTPEQPTVVIPWNHPNIIGAGQSFNLKTVEVPKPQLKSANLKPNNRDEAGTALSKWLATEKPCKIHGFSTVFESGQLYHHHIIYEE